MFDGNGNWTSDFSAISDRDNDIKILASRFDGIFIADIKESFENCLTKDGQIAPIGAFNMGGQKITNLANGTNPNDAVNLGQLQTIFSSLYPVGSLYIGTQATCPMATLISGSTWTLVSSGKALWTGDGTNANTTIAAGLPDHYHFIANADNGGSTTVSLSSSNYMTQEGGGSPTSHYVTYRLNGTNTAPTKGRTSSPSNNLYGASSTVQPPAYVVNVWRRTA